MLHASGDWPFNPNESFTADELAIAAELRQSQPKQRRGASAIFDQCPHTPACPTLAICIEEIAWFLRHRHELDGGHES